MPEVIEAFYDAKRRRATVTGLGGKKTLVLEGVSHEQARRFLEKARQHRAKCAERGIEPDLSVFTRVGEVVANP